MLHFSPQAHTHPPRAPDPGSRCRSRLHGFLNTIQASVSPSVQWSQEPLSGNTARFHQQYVATTQHQDSLQNLRDSVQNEYSGGGKENEYSGAPCSQNKNFKMTAAYQKPSARSFSVGKHPVNRTGHPPVKPALCSVNRDLSEDESPVARSPELWSQPSWALQRTSWATRGREVNLSGPPFPHRQSRGNAVVRNS